MKLSDAKHYRAEAKSSETDSWSDLNLAASGIACFQKEARQAQTVTGLLQRS